MSDTRPNLAAIHDKDNAHLLGVVGWRSEYHAMRAAIDAEGMAAFRYAAEINARAIREGQK